MRLFVRTCVDHVTDIGLRPKNDSLVSTKIVRPQQTQNCYK